MTLRIFWFYEEGFKPGAHEDGFTYVVLRCLDFETWISMEVSRTFEEEHERKKFFDLIRKKGGRKSGPQIVPF